MARPANEERTRKSISKRLPTESRNSSGSDRPRAPARSSVAPDHEWRFGSDALRQGVVFVDVEGNIRSGNRSLERALGLIEGKLGDSDARAPQRVIHPDGKPFRYDEQPAIVALRTGRTVSDVEMGVRDDKGQMRWLVATGQPVRDEDARIIGAVSSFVDITYRKEMELLLRQQRDFANLLLETAPIIVMVLDAAGRVDYMNPWGEQRMGFRLADIKGKSWLKIFFSETERAGAQKWFNAASASASTCSFVAPLLVRDGTERHVEWLDSLLPDEDAKSSGMLIIGRDVTANVAAERSLHEHQALLERRVAEKTGEWMNERKFIEATLDSAATLIVVTDPNGRIVRFNRACEAVSGRSFSTVKGHDIRELSTPGNAFPALDARMPGRSNFSPEQFECEWLRSDGARRLIAWRRAEFTTDQERDRFFVYTGTDITDLRALEQRERERHDALAHASRVAAVGELASILAHELTQPLMAVEHFNHAAIALLEAAPESRGQVLDMLQNADEQIRRCGDMIQQLRRFVRRGAPNKQLTDLMTMVANSIKLLQPLLTDRAVEIRTECLVGLPAVNVDAVQIEQVLVNLIRNGVDAMQESRGPRLLTIECSAHSDCVEIAVHDNGIGLDPSRATKLFDLYETTKKDGMGLGLAVSRSIIRAHGGQLQAEPRAQGGTTFRFSLPATCMCASSP